MNTYVCTVCGYVYYPSLGDIKGEIPAQTSFEDLPPKWVCPICGASKKLFEEQ